MAGTIGLNQVYFVARIASMKSAAENINISDMTNKSRDKYAYTLLDLENEPADDVIERLRNIKGVLRVRVV